jgi:serine/threonine protein kinase
MTLSEPLIFCLECKKPVLTRENSCPNCGLRLRENRETSPFLSGGTVSETMPVSLPAGTLLMDRFEVESFINQGRHSAVYLAKDLIRLIKVALKVVDIGPLGNKPSIFRSRREANVYQCITDFTHIIQLYDVGIVSWGGSALLLLSTEYANGGTLRDWILKHQADPETRATNGLDYFKQTCEGTLSLHQSKVIHCDLKPENLVFANGKLKISDLGAAICTVHQEEQQNGLYQCNAMSTGTPHYMAPECFDTTRLQIDSTADIYSLGIMLFELLHPQGYLPFEGTYDELRKLHAKVPVPHLPDCDERLVHIVHQCLAKRPEDRYQTIEKLLMDLDGKPSTASHESPPLDGETMDWDQTPELWEQASQFFSDGDFQGAFRLAEKIVSVQPEHLPAMELIDIINRRFEDADRFYQEISRNLENGDLDELVEWLKEASETYPEHPSSAAVQTKMLAKTRKYRSAMEAGTRALEEGQWEVALDYFQAAYGANPGACSLKTVIANLSQIRDVRIKVDNALMNRDFETAESLACFIDAKADEIFAQLTSDS